MSSALHLVRGFDDTKAPLEKVIEVVSRGLPVSVLDELARAYRVTRQTMAELAGVPARTLQRRRSSGRFNQDESERLFRYLRLYRRALAVFDDDPDSAREFLNTPQPGLDGQVPCQIARSEFGAEAVIDLLGRIDYGVYT